MLFGKAFRRGWNLSFRGALLRWLGKIWFLYDFLILIMKNYLEKNYRIVYNNTINTIHKGETQMRCPYCGFAESKVIDSRPTEESNSIRRRRECLKCQKRFTTYEKLEAISLAVIKKDQSRQRYDRGKVLKGIITACRKTSYISIGKWNRLRTILKANCISQ